MTDVKYMSDAEDRKCCKCGSWMEHWITHRGHNPDHCRACWRKVDPENLIGVHVQELFSDSGCFIVPLCESCAGKKNSLPVIDVEKDDLIREDACGTVTVSNNINKIRDGKND